jgi:putative transcriptional regulator
VHSGGPVQPTAVMIMAEFEDPAAAATLVIDDIGFVAAETDFSALGAAVRRVRVFAGLAGWAPGQLEAEIERDDWLIEDALPDDIFSHDPQRLWSTVLERKGGQFALVARMPEDPSLN